MAGEAIYADETEEQIHKSKNVANGFWSVWDSCKDTTLKNEFKFENASFTAPNFFTNDVVWPCAGFDSVLPDLDLFKDYLVCTKDVIVCIDVSKTTEDKLTVFNLLNREWKELPPLNPRRNSVLMHLVVDASTQSYQVIVAGSSGSGGEHLSRMTEVFDYRTWKWKRTGDLPGPDYALNDYQSGVYKDGCLYCIAFLDEEAGRGILQYSLNESKNWAYLIPFSTNSTILQLVESRGDMYLFSEQENENSVVHWIDRLELDIDDEWGVPFSLNSVVRSKKIGGRSLEVYPEYMCVPYSEQQPCVYNMIHHSGVVYEVRNHGQSEVLQAPPSDQGFSGDGFLSLNPMLFTIEPSHEDQKNRRSELGGLSRVYMRTI